MNLARRGSARAAVLALAVLACGGDDQRNRIAQLSEAGAPVDRMVGREAPWQPAAIGQWFALGDAARTGPGGGARLRFAGGAGLKMAPGTVVRFAARRSKSASVGIEVETGESVIEADDRGAVFDLAFGAAQIAGGGQLRVTASGDAQRFEVLVGTVMVQKGNQPEIELGVGAIVSVEVGAVSIQRAPAAPRAAPPVPDAGVPPADAAPAIPDSMLAVEGRGATIRVTPDGKFERLPAGNHPAVVGSTIRLRDGSRAEMRRGEQVVKFQGPAEFQVLDPETALAELSSGSGDVHATSEDVRIVVPGGAIIARRGIGDGSRARLEQNRNATSIQVVSGTIAVVGKSGGEEKVELGELAALRRDGRIEVRGRGPERADFPLEAGLSPVIHDHQPPTALAIKFDKQCSGAGIVEASSSKAGLSRAAEIAKGEGEAIISVPPGTRYYRVRCIDAGVLAQNSVASGQIMVVRDPGSRPLPRKVPNNLVDADGRRYTVLYQNRLPSFTFRWQTAVQREAYRLVVQPDRGAPLSFSADAPRYELESGKLREGNYKFWFENIDRRMRSKVSDLRIDFDNAAPSAYLRSPRVGEAWGDSVHIAGAALKGWAVRVGATELPLDHQFRFEADVTPPGKYNGLAVQLSHPQHGVHYYVRRNGRKR